jgi:hypothetical protein
MTQSEDATVKIRQDVVRGSCDEVTRNLEEVSDDISSLSLLMWLVSIVTLLRRYSPSPSPSTQVAQSRSCSRF